MTIERKNVVLAPVDQPNSNGVTITRQAVIDAISKLDHEYSGLVYGTFNDEPLDQYSITHRSSNFRLVDNQLICDVYVFDNGNGQIVSRYIDEIVFDLKLVGTVINNQIQSMKIISVGASFNK